MKKTIKIIIVVALAGFAGIVHLSTFLAAMSSPWVPTRKKDMKRILKAINPKRGETIYDLGSGDGRLCIEIAKKSKAKVIGVELSFLYYLISWLKIKAMGLGNGVKIIWGNFFTANIKNADKVFFYLTEKTAYSLGNKLMKELKQGAQVIAYNYPIPHWEPAKLIQSKKSDTPIYIYSIDNNLQKTVFSL